MNQSKQKEINDANRLAQPTDKSALDKNKIESKKELPSAQPIVKETGEQKQARVKKYKSEYTKTIDYIKSFESHTLEFVDEESEQMGDVQGIRRIFIQCEGDFDTNQISTAVNIQHFSLDGQNEFTVDTNGIRQFRRLETLDVNHFKETNFNPFSELKSLRQVESTNTTIPSLAPLAELPKLETLKLTGSVINDPSSFSGLTSLKRAYLSSTNVKTFSGLNALSRLESLSLNHSKISNLDGIEGMKSLKYLDVSNTEIENAEPLGKLLGLEKINLGQTKCSNIEFARHLPNLIELDIGFNSSTDLSPLRDLKKLDTIKMVKTKVENIEVLASIKSLTYVYYSKQLVESEKIETLRKALPKCKFSSF